MANFTLITIPSAFTVAGAPSTSDMQMDAKAASLKLIGPNSFSDIQLDAGSGQVHSTGGAITVPHKPAAPAGFKVQ